MNSILVSHQTTVSLVSMATGRLSRPISSSIKPISFIDPSIEEPIHLRLHVRFDLPAFESVL